MQQVHARVYQFFFRTFSVGLPAIAGATCAYCRIRESLMCHSLPTYHAAWVPDAQRGVLLWFDKKMRYLERSETTSVCSYILNTGKNGKLFGHLGCLAQMMLTFDVDKAGDSSFEGLQFLLFKWLYPKARFKSHKFISLGDTPHSSSATDSPYFLEEVFFPTINATISSEHHLRARIRCNQVDNKKLPYEPCTLEGELNIQFTL